MIGEVGATWGGGVCFLALRGNDAPGILHNLGFDFDFFGVLVS